MCELRCTSLPELAGSSPAFTGTFATNSSSALGLLQFAEASTLEASDLMVASSYVSIDVVYPAWYTVQATQVEVIDAAGTSYASASIAGNSDYSGGNYIMDSGTASLADLSPDTYDAIMSGLEVFSSDDYQSLSQPDECYQSLTRPIYEFPYIQFTFANSDGTTTSLNLAPQVYLDGRLAGCSSDYPYHIAFTRSSTDNQPYIFGNSFLSQYHTVFSQSSNTVSFATPSVAGRQAQVSTCMHID